MCAAISDRSVTEEPRPPSRGLSRGQVVLAAICWSTGGAAIKLSGATAPQLAAGRGIVAAGVLFLLFPAARRGWNRRVWVTSIFYAFTCALFVFANTLTTAGNTIFIQNTAPVWVLLLGPWLLRERATTAEKISVPISLAGCALFFFDDLSAGRLAGNLCAAATSVTYALLIIAYRKASNEEGLAATILGNLLITVVLAPFAVTGPVPTASDLLVFVYLGAIQQALAAVLFLRGLRGVSGMEGALLTLFEPLLSPVWAFLLVGERLGPLALLGAGLVLGATLWRFRAARTG